MTFKKGAAPDAADLTADPNPPVNLDNSARFTLGVTADRVEADAEQYRSYADRELDRAMQDVLPAATVKWLEEKRDAYNAWERQQVTNAVQAEMQEHCAIADDLRDTAHGMTEELNNLSAAIRARSLTTAQALSKLDAIQQQAARLRQRRDSLAASTRLSELKAAHPHRYMDQMHQQFRIPRKDVFTR